MPLASRLPVYAMLPPELVDLILDQLGIQDVLSWRSSCRCFYRMMVGGLRRRLRSLVGPFVRDSVTFLDVLARHRSLLGGLLALAFLTRERRCRFTIMEVYVPDSLFEGILDSVEGLLRGPVERIHVFSRVDLWSRRDVAQCVQFQLTSGLRVVLHQSMYWSALSPICRLPCTALFNYVSRDAFGCAYPKLTLAWRGLLADSAMFELLPFDLVVMNALAEMGVDISWSPARFTGRGSGSFRRWSPSLAGPTFRGPHDLLESDGVDAEEDEDRRRLREEVDVPATLADRLRPRWGAPPGWERAAWPFNRPIRRCFATERMCPKRVRYFGDEDSLVDFLDAQSPECALLQERQMSPFGTVIAWKLWSSYRCAMSITCGAMIPENTYLRGGRIWMPAIPGRPWIDVKAVRKVTRLCLYGGG